MRPVQYNVKVKKLENDISISICLRGIWVRAFCFQYG